MKVFVTVGSTRFDALVNGVKSKAGLEALAERGYTDVVIQAGAQAAGDGGVTVAATPAGTSVEVYAYKPSIADDMESADLIISHAGAGSIVEALRAEKKLLVVVNEALMDNHQLELAEAMASKGHCVYCTPPRLLSVLRESDFDNLVPFPPAKEGIFETLLDDLVNFEERTKQQ